MWRTLWVGPVAAAIAVTAALGASGAVPRPAGPPGTLRTSGDPAVQGHDDPPEEPQPSRDTYLDHALNGGRTAPVFSRPSHSFDDPDGWAACPDLATEPGVSTWNGCDPFEPKRADYYHYDKPYGRSTDDLVAFVRWEPGRFERAGTTLLYNRGYYQSDRWDGPLSWDDAGYWDPRTRCGGYYAENHHVRSPETPASQEQEHPLPFLADGHGGRACLP